MHKWGMPVVHHIDGLPQERLNSIADIASFLALTHRHYKDTVLAL